MKKSLLLLASMLVSAVSFAQWTKPVPTAQDLTLNDTVYLYNVEAGGFLKGANDWNTRASVASDGYKVIIKTAYEDEEGTVPTGHYWICDSVETQSAVKAMFADNAQSIWVDNLAGANVDQWDITKLDNGYYQITNFGCYDPATAVCPLGVAEYYQGATGNTRLWLYDTKLTYTHDVDDEEVEDPVFSGNFYSNWIFVSPAEYATFQPKIAQYNAAMSLKTALDAAKAEYEGKIDFSSVEAVYNNTSSTVEELQAAEEKITTLITEYKSGLASYDDPLDMTDLIGDGSSVTPWTQTFTGSGTTGSHTTNTWSVEADGGADGTDMTTPFCEHWVASGGKLSDQKIYQKLSSLPPGLYKLNINVRAYSEAGGIDHFETLKMFFGNDSINLQDQVDMFKSGTKCVLWKKGGFTIISVLKEMSDVELGFEITGANFNWLAFKESSLTYYGNEDVEENLVKLRKDSYGIVDMSDADANPSLKEEYATAKAAFDAATSSEDIEATAKAALAAKTAIEDNVTAYGNLLTKIDTWETASETRSDLTGEEWGLFCDWIGADAEDGEEVEGWPMPLPMAIKAGNRSLLTDEVNSYITTADSLYAAAIAHSLVEGTDCSDMLVNPKFNDPKGGGWTKAKGSITMYGGLYNFPVAESWHSSFDLYQEITDVPDGIYSVSLNGFCRLDGETTVGGEIYMNDYSTPMKDIDDVDQLVWAPETDPAPEKGFGVAENGFNCYNDITTWTTNPVFWVDDIGTACGHSSPNNATDTSNEHDGVVYYAPNGMEGASVAFSAGRYRATVYGFVTGGKMKLGIRCSSSGQWVLFSNFTLTYEGKSVNAMKSILPGYVQTLNDYIDENSDNMTDPEVTAALAVVDGANDALDSEDADLMWEYVEKCNSALAAAKSNVSAYTAWDAANVAVDEAVETYSSTATTEAMNSYYAYSDKAGSIKDMTTAEVVALTEEANDVAVALRVPSTDGASAENPIDMTQVIVNPGFDEATTTGWSGDAPATNSTVYDAEFYNKTYHMYQSFKNLPAGYYVVSVQGFYRQGYAANDYASYTHPDSIAPAYNAHLYIAADADTVSTNLPMISSAALASSVAPYASDLVTVDSVEVEGVNEALVVPNTMTSAGYWFSADYYNDAKVGIKLEAGQVLTLGLIKKTTITGDWTLFDNFKLEYTGSEIPSSVNSVASTSTTVSSIYSISGARINKLQKGINIVKMADGTVRKVMVK